ncbi:transposase [Shewanella sp. VB17]|uniref:transposase n=1 Tax=Shewanella sp. VB17 TaxID=2739432 RepID=UPI001567256A|nr:transposase [Shewanella sp. VB17]NRD73484.1 transposase [Shewanella sp. VB17]
MTTARRALIAPESTPFYHVINRCVRRAFLCGEDGLTGQSYEHRRGWIVDRVKDLSTIFCIDVCAYAVMNNHYHLVLKIDVDGAQRLNPKDVISRWLQLFHGHEVAAKYLKGDSLSDGERMLLDGLITKWHERLSSISWFMRCLNEGIARKANREDGCKGAFWEGRFKSQALLDEQALLACMMYVDLNPIRAGIADSLQDADFTSIQERIRELSNAERLFKIHDGDHRTAIDQAPSDVDLSSTEPMLAKPLLSFDGAISPEKQQGIPFHFSDYLELIDWTGRAIRPDKRGSIDEHRPKLLTELGIASDAWMLSAKAFRRQYGGVSGRWDAMCAFKVKHSSGKWCKGKLQSEALHPH